MDYIAKINTYEFTSQGLVFRESKIGHTCDITAITSIPFVEHFFGEIFLD